jgi:hypothetical protein
MQFYGHGDVDDDDDDDDDYEIYNINYAGVNIFPSLIFLKCS